MFRLTFAPALLLLACAAPAQDAPAWVVPPAMAGRNPATWKAVAAESGGNEASTVAIATGLKWLANQQKPGGFWEFDPADPKHKTKDWATATGLALLPFLGVNQTHVREGKYKTNVADGLTWLKNDINLATGRFNHGGQRYLYGHGVAALALCEAYALTGDDALKMSAQAAVNYIIRGQAADGGWGEQAAQATGDLAITAWQLQALDAARVGKLTVPDETIEKAVKFLNAVSSGSLKAVHGRTKPDGRPGTALSAAGLWCRYHFDGWGPNNAGMAEGTIGLFGVPKAGATGTVTATDRSRAPRTLAQLKENPGTPDVEYGYFATQVVCFFGGQEWQEWNVGPTDAAGKRLGGMRDGLVFVQSKTGNDTGSWNPDPGTVGTHSGRLGTTAFALLILETPYRYAPHFRPNP